jgi:primosomal protein N' (replication factor Y)
MVVEKRSFYGSVTVMGPIEAPLPRIARQHRWQILTLSSNAAGLHRFIHELILGDRGLPATRQVKVTVDVDPFFLM